MRTFFLVGRVTPKSTEIVVLDPGTPPPFPGPWVLRALVRRPRSRTLPDGAAERLGKGFH
jgi:hypothetical protein